MAMYLLLVHYLRPIEEVDTLLEQHKAFLARQYQRGSFVVSGPRTVRHLGGVILARAENERTVRAIIAEDPFVQQGMARYEIVPFRVTKHADEFAPLVG